jgi:single-strand DNA-binding protein
MSAIECAFFGALGRDAERKTSQSGKPCLRLNVRVGDDDAAQWISVLAFDECALVEVADKLVKGARVYVEGRLSTNEWTGQDGEKRLGLSVLSWHCRLAAIGRNKAKRERETSVAGGYVSPRSAPAGRLPGELNDEIPFAPEVR